MLNVVLHSMHYVTNVGHKVVSGKKQWHIWQQNYYLIMEQDQQSC
jgi:hypothetical protein